MLLIAVSTLHLSELGIVKNAKKSSQPYFLEGALNLFFVDIFCPKLHENVKI